MSIEAIERAALMERTEHQSALRQAVGREAERSARDAEQRQLEAETAYQALQECGDRLQKVYDHSNRSLKDRLHTAILQIRNSQGELTQVHSNLQPR
jgi:hypothetical protein